MVELENKINYLREHIDVLMEMITHTGSNLIYLLPPDGQKDFADEANDIYKEFIKIKKKYERCK